MAETEDGYTLLRNKQGDYEYAVLDPKGDLVASGILAKDIKKRSYKEKLLLQHTPKRLSFSKAQSVAIKEIAKSRNALFLQSGLFAKKQLQKNGSSNEMQVVRFPVILIEFPDKRFTRTSAEFQALCNNLNYTATADGTISGSVRDYYRAASYNRLDMQFDVYGPFMMPDSIYHYDDESGGSPREMARIAAQKADEAGCDFTQYDMDGDGTVDGIHIVYAGYDQSAGEPAGQAIWAHRWSVYPTEQIDGKYISAYSCNSELMWNSNQASWYPSICANKIQQIGVFCHELGHVLGLPDMYDTDYSGGGGQAVDLSTWCLMNSGSWNGPQNKGGCTPPIFSAWCREQLGWFPVYEIGSTKHITMPNPHTANPANDTIILKYTTATPNEYFLIENKQKTGWDEYVPASGMLIYHIDGNHISNTVWQNTINCNPAHRGIYIKQAGGGEGSDNENHEVSPFPYAGNNQFTDQSTPSSLSWSGVATQKPITNITHNTANRSIEFDFMLIRDNERTITVSVNPANTTGTAIGGGIYQVGSQCTVEARNADGAIFENWTENGQIVSTSAIMSFTVSDNRNLVANFRLPCLDCPNYDAEISPTEEWQVASGEIEIYGCKMYRFYGTAGDKFTFKTGCGDGATASFDTKLDLFSSNCNMIATNDDGQGCESLRSKIEEYEVSQTGHFYIKVYGYNNNYGTFSLAYKADRNTIVTPPSSNASLATLTVSEETLSPYFTAEHLNYFVTVQHSVESITISATAEDQEATIVGTGIKTLNYGTNTFTVVVTAEDQTSTKTYTIVVTRQNPPSSNASLATLTVSEGTLSPDFTDEHLNYFVTVQHSVESITISATAEDQEATIVGTGIKTLNYGTNTFTVVVTAEDQTSTKTYTIVVTREDEPTTTIEDISNKNITILPNPTTGLLYIESEKDISHIDILGINGYTKTLSANNPIDISDIPQGIYFIKVVFKDGSESWQKVIKR